MLLVFMHLASAPTFAQGRGPISSASYFIENVGQIKDQFGKTRNDIQYKLSANGMGLFVGNGKLHYQFNNPKDSLINTYRLDMTLIGANKNAVIKKYGESAYYEKYYLPGLDAAKAYAYNKITYQNIYKGIDWVLYVKDGQLEYDFVVHPGANANDIKIRYDGATRLQKQDDGSILAQTPVGSIKENIPFTYQLENKQPLASSFRLKKDILSFNVPRSDATIVIDPTVMWSTYFGGNYFEYAYSSATDVFGNVVIVGYTNSGANVATTGSFQTVIGGGTDGYLAKFNASGNLLWATYYGGGPLDYLTDVVCDDAGNIYVAGDTRSVGMATAGSYQSTFGGNSDVFLAKFNSSGTRLWASYYGGSGWEGEAAIAYDNKGYIYVSGFTLSDDSIASSGAFKDTISGGEDVFLAKFDLSGTRLWATYYGGSSNDEPSHIAIDTFGSVYVGGNTQSYDNIATAGAYKTAYSGTRDGFLVKFNSSGGLLWGTYFGDAGDEIITGITTDYVANVYATGITTSASGIATIDAFKTSFTGSSSAFLSKFTGKGFLQWSTYYGDSSKGENVTCDRTGCVFFEGTSLDIANIATLGVFQSVKGGHSDIFITKFAPFGQRLWGSYFGGPDYEPTTASAISASQGGVVCDKDNIVYFTSSTRSNTQIATPGAYQTSLNGFSDAFLVKINTDTTVIISQFFQDTLMCKGAVFALPYRVNYNFNPGNTFIAQLSDASGSFASPTTIGTTASFASGSITCTIPTTITVGSGYRIRLVASAPAFVSPDNGYNITIAASIARITSIAANAPVCIGDTLKLSATAVKGAAYAWSGPAAFSSVLQSPALQPFATVNAGKYYVTATATGCNTVKDSITVAVKSPTAPAMTIAFSPSVFLPGDSITFFANNTNCGTSPSYKWYKNNVLIPGATSYTYGTMTWAYGDVMTATAYCSGFCSSPDTVQGATAPLSVNMQDPNVQLILYPNPVKDNIEIKNALGCAYTITNINGQILMHGTITKQHEQLNISLLQQGIYFIQLTSTQGERSTQKFVKE